MESKTRTNRRKRKFSVRLIDELHWLSDFMLEIRDENMPFTVYAIESMFSHYRFVFPILILPSA